MTGRNDDTRMMPSPDCTLSFEDPRGGETRRGLLDMPPNQAITTK